MVNVIGNVSIMMVAKLQAGVKHFFVENKYYFIEIIEFFQGGGGWCKSKTIDVKRMIAPRNHPLLYSNYVCSLEYPPFYCHSFDIHNTCDSIRVYST